VVFEGGECGVDGGQRGPGGGVSGGEVETQKGWHADGGE
jgi:hypothetical protein